MILPSKHLSQDRALLTVGATILKHLALPVTVSSLWEQIGSVSEAGEEGPHLRYDAFVLTLDLLFMMGAIDLREGVLHRRTP